MSQQIALGSLRIASAHEPRPEHSSPSPFRLVDLQRRTVRYVRISLTDRCNYRCTYCMPAEGVEVMPRAQLLSHEEITRLVRIFVSMGISRVRLTGGEPLTRRGVVGLVSTISAIDGLEDLAMTTNGYKLLELAEPLRQAGLSRLNVSLDTLRPERFAKITRQGVLQTVLDGLIAASKAGFTGIKLNAVMLRGVNDAETPELLMYAREQGHILRFIEYMPIGTDSYWGPETFISGAELRQRLESAGWMLQPQTDSSVRGGGPARHWSAWPAGVPQRPELATTVGFITAVSEHFCETCNRVRVSPVGVLRECLSTPGSLSLRDMLRQGASDAAVKSAVRDALDGKVDSHRFDRGQTTMESMVQIGG